MKAWYKSKTMWIGIFEAIAGGVMLYEDFLTQAMQGDAVGWVLFGSGVAKIVLRSITDTPVGRSDTR
jgi:hypothetical protein